MESVHAPGLSIALVEDGEVVYAEGPDGGVDLYMERWMFHRKGK